MIYMAQMIPKNISTILHFQFNYHTLPVTPFKEDIKKSETCEYFFPGFSPLPHEHLAHEEIKVYPGYRPAQPKAIVTV